MTSFPALVEEYVSYHWGRTCHVCDHGGRDKPADGMIFNRKTGVWHWGEDYGVTYCGKDATADHWWWPL